MRKLLFIPFIFMFCISHVYAQGFSVSNPSILTVYESSVHQDVGTTVTHDISVTNNGNVKFDSVFLEITVLPRSWYSTSNITSLDMNETKTINYTLITPSDAVGSISFDVHVKGVKGFGVVLDIPLKIDLTTSIAAIYTPTTSSTTKSAVSIVKSSFQEFSAIYVIPILAILVVLVILWVRKLNKRKVHKK